MQITRVAKAASISCSLPALRIESCNPFSRTVSCKSRITGSIAAFVGFTRRAIDLAWGTNSQRNSNRFGVISLARMLTPVTLRPGRARLATRPTPTGSPTPAKTTGIVEVASFAARAGGVPPAVKIRSTLSRTRSAVPSPPWRASVSRP